MTACDLDSFRPLTPAEFGRISRLAYDTFGLDLRAGKESLVTARLAKIIREAGCRSFDEFYKKVQADPSGDHMVRLIDALTTNHTSFFRESAHFDYLRTVILPGMQNRFLEVWSAACSSGEEPYSLAMVLLEAMGPQAVKRVRILATDISTRVLAQAQKAVYPAERFEGMPAALLRKYWLRGERDWAGWYRAKKDLRSMVEFRRLNLVEQHPPVGRFPVIFCRNVMIYFDRPTQQKVVNHLVRCLEPGGHLFIGHAETLNGVSHSLRYIRPACFRNAGEVKT